MNLNYGFSWITCKFTDLFKVETVILYPTNMFNVSGGRIYIMIPKLK